MSRRTDTDTVTEPAEADAPPVVGVHAFIGGDHRRAIDVAGLVADQPELAEAQLTETDWAEQLQGWLDSPRP